MSTRDFGEGSSSSSAQAFGSNKRTKVVHQLRDSLYEFYEPEGNPSMQIVFVHGIHSEDSVAAHLSTWESHSESEDGLFFWPQRWLAEEFPSAHIFTANYSGGMGKSSDGKLDIHLIAENLLWDLMQEKVGQMSSCPVVLVGHCFGGIVIKQLCVQANKQSRNSKESKAFIENVRGVFYYGTPHHGFPFISQQADQLHTPLLNYLKILSNEAARVTYEFDLLHSNWQIHGIGESLPTKSTLFPNVVAVPEGSAREGDSFSIVKADHISISKPASKIDKRFSALKDFIHKVASTSEGEARECRQTPMEGSRPQNFQYLPKEMIDMQVQVKEIVKKLETVRILGFVGMGGLGKTTLAKVVFNELSSRFDYSCFVSDVKLVTGREDNVEEEFWKCLHFQGRKVGGQCNLATLRGKRLLLVLDNVSERDGKVLLDLAEDTDPGSRFISTSRECDLLRGLGEVYEVSYLDSNQAELLFMRHAFRDAARPCSELESMLECIVKKCDGLPLALEVVGKYLHGKVKQKVWKQTLIALKKAEKVKNLNEKLWAKLRISFDNLGENEQQVFLDATNFFVYCEWTLADAKLAWTEIYGKVGELLWQTLVDMSLVYNVEDNEGIMVHEQLQSLGRMIASEPKNKGKYKIFYETEALTTLEGNFLSNGQDCHALRLVSDRAIHISNAAFHKLRNLRFLEVNQEVVIDGATGNVSVPTKLVILKCVGHVLLDPSLQNHLAVLEVRNLEYIRNSIGKLSYLNRLAIRCMGSRLLPKPIEYSSLQSLPESFGGLGALQHPEFGGCDSLQSLPESFGGLKALQHLEFEGCDSLQSLPESFGGLRALQHLKFKGCHSLQSLPESFGGLGALEHLTFTFGYSLRSLPESFGRLGALQHLKFGGCDSLQSLPESFGGLGALQHLTFTFGYSLWSLPESFGRLGALQHLEFGGCHSLQSLPESFGGLKALQHLKFGGCDSLQSLPESFSRLPALQYLDFYRCDSLRSLPESFGGLGALEHLTFTFGYSLWSLPESFGQLGALQHLEFRGCHSLQSLPESFGGLKALQHLEFGGCHSLQSLPESFGGLRALQHLKFGGCDSLQSLPESFGQLPALQYLDFYRCDSLRSLPESFGGLRALKYLIFHKCHSLQSLPESFGGQGALEYLTFHKCDSLQSLPKCFGGLGALQHLTFYECDSLQSLPESFGRLGALERLTFNYCSSLQSLPETFGQLGALEVLEVMACGNLKFLPRSFGQLSNLTNLYFLDCGIESQLFAGEEGEKDEATTDNKKRDEDATRKGLMQDMHITVEEVEERKEAEDLQKREHSSRPDAFLKVNDSLFELHKPKGTPTLEIIFFHGLYLGNSSDVLLSTWELEDGSIWPKEWLAEDYPSAHIFTVSYSAGVEKTSYEKFDLYLIVENLISDLRAANIGQTPCCPVVLVGHSFGGLVIKQLCLELTRLIVGSRKEESAKLQTFLDNLRGIVYYASHHGVPRVSSQADDLNSPFLEYWSEVAERLDFDFDILREVYAKWQVHGLVESLPGTENSGMFQDGVAASKSCSRQGDLLNMVVADYVSISKPSSKEDIRPYALTALLKTIARNVDDDVNEITRKLETLKVMTDFEDLHKQECSSRPGTLVKVRSSESAICTENPNLKMVKDFITEINIGDDSGYFVSKAWMLSLDDHEDEALTSALRQTGYLEIYETDTTVFYEKINGLSCTPENNDFGDFEDPEVIASARSFEKRRQSAPVQSDQTPLMDSPKSIQDKGKMPLATSNEILESFKTAIQDTSLDNYSVSTQWLSTLSKQEEENLKFALLKAGYLEIERTSTTAYFERLQGHVRNNPKNESESSSTFQKRSVVGGAESRKAFQGSEGLLADDRQRPNIDKQGSSSVTTATQESHKREVTCPCHPQDLTVSCRPEPSEEPSTSSSSQGEHMSKWSTRKAVGNSYVTMPKFGEGKLMRTGADKRISMSTYSFSGGSGFDEVPLTVSAYTSLTCCLKRDPNEKKVCIEFSTIGGKVKIEDNVNLNTNTVVLRSVRSNVDAYIIRSEETDHFELISLYVQESDARRQWRKVLKTCELRDENGQPRREDDLVWMELSGNQPQNSELGSKTLELQCHVNNRLRYDLERCCHDAHVLQFTEADAVILEGKILGDLKSDTILELNVRYQVVISYNEPRLPKAGQRFVATTRQDKTVDFDFVLEFRTRKLSSSRCVLY